MGFITKIEALPRMKRRLVVYVDGEKLGLSPRVWPGKRDCLKAGPFPIRIGSSIWKRKSAPPSTFLCIIWA